MFSPNKPAKGEANVGLPVILWPQRKGPGETQILSFLVECPECLDSHVEGTCVWDLGQSKADSGRLRACGLVALAEQKRKGEKGEGGERVRLAKAETKSLTGRVLDSLRRTFKI